MCAYVHGSPEATRRKAQIYAVKIFRLNVKDLSAVKTDGDWFLVVSTQSS